MVFFWFLSAMVLLATGLFTTDAWETAQPVKDCGSPLAQLTKLEIIPPCGKDSCVLKRGERITLFAEFTPRVNSTDLFVNGYSRDPIFGQEAFLFKETICSKKFNITCPIEANKPQYVYFSEIISNNSPVVRFVIKMLVTSDSGQRLLCQSSNFEIK